MKRRTNFWKGRWALGMVLVIFLTAACGAPDLLSEDFVQDNSLVTGDPCAAPCWLGITPGETTWQEALTIIEDDPRFVEVEVEPAPDAPETLVATWRVAEGEACCQMIARGGEVVSVIFPRFAPQMTVGQVVEKYGEPAYFVANAFSREQALASLVYPETPMIVLAFIAGLETGEITASSEVIGTIFITPDDMELLLQTSDLYGWDGYGPYQRYSETEFDVTPSVTITPAGT